MKSFGPYEVIEEIAHHRGTVVYKAREGGTEAAVKVFHLAHFADGNPAKVEELSKWFYRTVEMQKNVGEKSSFIAPILCYGMQGEAAWEVTPLYQNSVQKVLAARANVSRENFQQILESVLQGAMDLKEHYGRSHGNLKPANVLLDGDVRGRLNKIQLCDPAPGDGAQSEKFEVADLRAIGQLMYLLLCPTETRDPSTWRLSTTQPPSAWTGLFGAQTTAWINLCLRLMDPGLTSHSYSLEKLALDLLKLKPATRPPRKPPILAMAGAAAAVIVAVAGFLFWKSSQTKPSDSAQNATSGKLAASAALREKEEAARKAAEEVKRLEEEKRRAEQQAMAASAKAESQAKRLAEEKRLLEAKSRQNAEANNAAVDQARRDAAEKAAELEQLRNSNEAEKEAAARKAAELKRQIEEARTREIAADLARQQELQRAASSRPSPVTANPSTLPKPAQNKPWVNTLGMRFVPAGGKNLLVCIWETRRKDFEEFIQQSRRPVDPAWRKTTFPQTGLHPVVNVTASDAESFCDWLTDSERDQGLLGRDQAYRLPSDTEWMAFAARMSNDQEYSWGNVWPPPSGIGNYGSTYTYDRFDFTAPVGQFRANPAGLYDVAGNVWEICRANPLSSALGGSWLTVTPDQLSLAATVPLRPTDKREDIGFRCVLDLGR